MGKNRDIEIISNIITQAVIHKIVPDYSNKPESRDFMEKEEENYRNLSFKEMKRRNWNDEDKKKIKEEVIRKVQNKISIKYPDIIIQEEKLLERINQELFEYFR